MLLWYLASADDPLSHVLPHRLHLRIGPFDVTNQMLMALVAAALMLLIFPAVFRRQYAGAPRGTRNFLESILDFLRTEVFRPALKEHTDRFVPFLWTLFFFILLCNLLGSIPIAETVSLLAGRESHIGGTATGNINTTAGLALCAFAFIHLSGIAQVARALVRGTYGHHNHGETHDHAGAEHGGGHGGQERRGMGIPAAALLAVPLYFWNFAPHPFRPGPGGRWTAWLADVPVWALLLVLELIGALIKPVALSIRLFANMIAGHIVLAVLVGLIVGMPTILGQIGVGIPITAMSLMIRLLELFVAFLQAYIFTFLTTLFIAGAVAPEH